MSQLTTLPLLVAFLFIPSIGMGQIHRQVEALRGVDAFQALVTVSGDCLGEMDMRSVEASIQVRLELSLRREGAGISREAPAPPLGLEVKTLRAANGLCSYMLQLSLYEVVPLRGRSAMVIVWQMDGVGMVGASAFREAAISAADDLITSFLNDYLTANPKG